MNPIGNFFKVIKIRIFEFSEKSWLFMDYVGKMLQSYLDSLALWMTILLGNLVAGQVQHLTNLISGLIELNWERKLYWPFNLLRIILFLFLMFALVVISTSIILVLGNLGAIFGFRNLGQYHFKEQFAAWLPVIILILICPLFCGEYSLYRICLVVAFTVALVGQDFLFGQCGIVSIGQAGFLLSGGFITTWLINGTFGFEVPFILAIMIAALSNGFLGFLLGLPALRIKDEYLVIVSLALTLAMPFVLQSKYLAGIAKISEGGVHLRKLYLPEMFAWMNEGTFKYFLIVIPSMVMIGGAYNLIHHSQIGRALQTIKCDKEISMILGVPATKYKLLAFSFSAIYTGFGGGLLVVLVKFISKDTYSMETSLNFLIANVFCGPGGILGSVLGGVFLAVLPDMTDFAAQHLAGGAFLAQCGYGVVLILTTFFMPLGLANEFSQRLKNNWIGSSRRGGFLINPPEDYDFLANQKEYFKRTKL